jgi:hypothetical protein
MTAPEKGIETFLLLRLFERATLLKADFFIQQDFFDRLHPLFYIHNVHSHSIVYTTARIFEGFDEMGVKD